MQSRLWVCFQLFSENLYLSIVAGYCSNVSAARSVDMWANYRNHQTFVHPDLHDRRSWPSVVRVKDSDSSGL